MTKLVKVPSKPWFKSKTMWVNLIAGVAMMVQASVGEDVFDVKAQAGILALVNGVLRLVTNQGLV